MATATESSVLEAQPRTSGNKNVARRVRMGGKIPGVLYGAGKQSLPVTLDPRQVRLHMPHHDAHTREHISHHAVGAAVNLPRGNPFIARFQHG